MSDQKHTNMSVENFLQNFKDIVRGIENDDDQIIISENGKPVAALISIEAYKFLQEIIDKLDYLDATQIKNEEEITPFHIGENFFFNSKPSNNGDTYFSPDLN